jgi:hypothetical protein
MYEAGMGSLPIPNEVRGQDEKLSGDNKVSLIYLCEMTRCQVTPSYKRSKRTIACEWLEKLSQFFARSSEPLTPEIYMHKYPSWGTVSGLGQKGRYWNLQFLRWKF